MQRVAGIVLALWGASPAAILWAQELIALPTRPNVTQSYFLTSRPKNLEAVAILFPGSGGWIHLRIENGKPRFNAGNFLVRSRVEFVKRGVVAAIVDAPSDQQRGWGMTDEFRLGENHFADVSALIADLGKRFPGAPVFLVGTSRGSVSAAALGARFDGRVAGVVLTSSTFRSAVRKSNEQGPGLEGFDFAAIKVPALLVHHVGDQCPASPYSEAARLAERFPLITVFGGNAPRSAPCDAFSQHGYFGKESETVEEIVNWMLKKRFREEVR